MSVSNIEKEHEKHKSYVAHQSMESRHSSFISGMDILEDSQDESSDDDRDDTAFLTRYRELVKTYGTYQHDQK